MAIELIDRTERYSFSRISRTFNEKMDFTKVSKLETFYLHTGNANLELRTKGGVEEIALREGEGVVVTPGVSYRLNTQDSFLAYTVSSEVKSSEPIIEIIDDGETKSEVPLPPWKIIRSPKKVNKPWGHELWVVWTRDYHVMKQIAMNPDRQSSLQFHREKLETNTLQEGSAVVIDGYRLNPQAPEEEVQASSRGVDFFQQYSKEMGQGDWWTSHPGTVHRVIAGPQGYLAYEVSTPELDDVIRLQDDTGRVSGRIESEHQGGKN